MSPQSKRGFSISIFLVDGTPDGLKIVEKSNSIGKGVVCPRSRFAEMKSRDEFSKTGVYILRGPSDAGDLPTIYIGEGDPTLPRLEQHFAKKDFWTSLTLFMSKDENLNKAHVQFLESRLVNLATEAKRCILDNAKVPQLPSLSEPDTAEMETFLEEILLILPVLGITVFERPQVARPSERMLFIRAKGIEAKGYDAPQGFVVLSGSQASGDTVPSIQPFLIDVRNGLIKQGILAPDEGFLRLTQDYTFESPSTAAGVVLGRSANGRIEWKDESGRTLKEIQTASVTEHSPS